MDKTRLWAAPCTRVEAQEYIRRFHRHNKPPVSAIFQVAAIDEDGHVRGVAMAGRPMARHLCDSGTIEIVRVATDGCPNSCSFLLALCRRIAFGLGYSRVITYTLESESGSSLRASGWKEDLRVTPRTDGWNRPKRDRESQSHNLGAKIRWAYRTHSEAKEPIWPEQELDESQLTLFDVGS